MEKNFKVKLEPEIVKFLKLGNGFHQNEVSWYQHPLWYKTTTEEGIFEQVENPKKKFYKSVYTQVTKKVLGNEIILEQSWFDNSIKLSIVTGRDPELATIKIDDLQDMLIELNKKHNDRQTRT